jgi:small subunit ribosomal protein S16
MAVKIRMSRTGANKDICYRVVVTDSRSPRDGKIIENVGWYDPKQQGANFGLKLERIAYWRERGAQISETVNSLLRRSRRAATG